MSPQESQVLQNLLNQLVQTRGVTKDAQAVALINTALAQQPDAAYLLVLRVLMQDQALAQAQAQIAQLQSELQTSRAPSNPSFIDPANTWGRTASPMYSSPAAPAAPMQGPAPRTGFLGGGMGSILGSVATTAAGVAGGALLFQGIESLMGHHSGNGFMGQMPTENMTVNNYYADDPNQADPNTGDNGNGDYENGNDFDDSADDSSSF